MQGGESGQSSVVVTLPVVLARSHGTGSATVGASTLSRLRRGSAGYGFANTTACFVISIISYKQMLKYISVLIPEFQSLDKSSSENSLLFIIMVQLPS